jgi:hypothetical protein
MAEASDGAASRWQACHHEQRHGLNRFHVSASSSNGSDPPGENLINSLDVLTCFG